MAHESGTSKFTSWRFMKKETAELAATPGTGRLWLITMTDRFRIEPGQLEAMTTVLEGLGYTPKLRTKLCSFMGDNDGQVFWNRFLNPSAQKDEIARFLSKMLPNDFFEEHVRRAPDRPSVVSTNVAFAHAA